MTPPLPARYRLRPAEAADAPALPAIERDAAELFRTIGVWGAPFEGARSVEQHLAAAEAGIAWVVAHDGAPCAFALGSLLDGHLHLHELAVLRAHQRRGLGRALLAAIVDHARWRLDPTITLTTDRFAPWNAPFYQRHGFVEVERSRLTPDLAALLEAERQEGFDMSRRVAMAKVL
jgi:GNAT superfamily N-acetyltransferase